MIIPEFQSDLILFKLISGISQSIKSHNLL